MDLIVDVTYGTANYQMRKIDDVFCYMLKLFKEQNGYTEKLILSYFFHKIAFIKLTKIFEQFPLVDQDYQRKAKINDHFKTMRKIYKVKYNEMDIEHRKEIKNAKCKSKK